jgi:alkylation response protein AidB-like acyl-CoA dehydrogenase
MFRSRCTLQVSKFGSQALKEQYLPQLASLDKLASYCPINLHSTTHLHLLSCFDSCCILQVSKFGSQALKEQYLPQLTSLDKLASYCLTEPGSGSDAASLTTSAVPVEGGWLLSGSKAFISGAGASDVYLVMARCQGQMLSQQEVDAAAAEGSSGSGAGSTVGSGSSSTNGAAVGGSGAITAFLVEKEWPGVSFGASERKMGEFKDGFWVLRGCGYAAVAGAC